MADVECVENDSFDERILFHQTSPEAAASILSSQCMRPGTSGLAGGAIYFADSANDTHHKAQRGHGVILRCRVRLGRIWRISESGDSSLTHSAVRAAGYDSVLIPRVRGYEYAVYCSSQVVDISIH